ncbi:MAG: efflux RND transporter periplasmic adaptor subunit [Acidobacteria bacterium]|nr:efflux RND transporter periplasmic adaptor subunit [Acidobacteriota bacterium]
MRVRIVTDHGLESMGWSATKIFCLIVALGAAVGPATRGLSSSRSSGIRTVLPAVVRAGAAYTVTAGSEARVVSVLVAAGQRVEAGQLLAVLESEEVTRAYERARLRLQIAERKLAAAGGSAPAARIREEQQRAAVRSLEASQHRLKDFSMAGAERAYATVKARLDGIERLRAQKLATDGEAETARRDEQNEFRNLQSAREHWSRLGQEVEAAESQLRLLSIQLNSAEDTSPLAARLEYEEAVALCEDAAQKVKNLRVLAPGPGVVLSAAPDPGERVLAGTHLFHIADLSRLNLEARVSAAIAGRIQTGLPVRLRIPTDPPRDVDAAVSAVSVAPDSNQQSYVVRATIANLDWSVILVGLEGAMEFSHLER